MHALALTLFFLMQIRTAISKDGAQVFVRDQASGQLVQRTPNTAWAQMFARATEESGGGGQKLTAPYARSTWVRAAIGLITGPITSVPLCFAADGRGSKTRLVDPALTEFWAAPAIGPVQPAFLMSAPSVQGGRLALAEVIEATVGWLKLRGQAFWVFDDSWLFHSARQRSPFIIAPPSRMREEISGTELLSWEYSDGGGMRHRLKPEQVLHIKMWNPYHDVCGSAPYDNAQTAAEADFLAGEYGRNLMRNNGDRGPFIIGKNGVPSDEQQKQIVRVLREKRAAAARGEFRPAFLVGDITVEDPKAQAMDTALIAQRIENRDEIAVAMGVPPSFFHTAASYSIGSASDYFRLIETGCMPVAAKLADAVESVSRLLRGGKPVSAWWDFSQHSTMQQVRSERLGDFGKLWAIGMPAKEAGEYLSLGLPRFPGDDQGYLPFSVAAVDGASAEPLPEPGSPAAGQGDTGTGGQGDEPTAPLDKLVRLLEARRAPALPAPLSPGLLVPLSCSCGTITLDDLATRAGDTTRLKLWKFHMLARRAAVKRCEAKFSKVLQTARAEVLAKIGASEGKAVATKAAAADFLFDLSKFTGALKGEMRKAALASLTEAGTALFTEVAKDDVYTMPPARVTQFVKDRENKLTDVAENIFARIKEALQDGLDDGESTAKLAARIKATFNEIDDGRAMTIAQTETSAAYGYARQDAMDQAGVEWKEWLTSGLDNVRTTHLEAEGQRQTVNDPFSVGAAKLFFPGDPAGPPNEVINCHCVAIAVADGGDKT